MNTLMRTSAPSPSPFSLLRCAAAALALSITSLPVLAQNAGASGDAWDKSGSSNSSASSWLPYTSHGYAGINLGQASFDEGHCAAGFKCDDPSFSGTIYTGGMFNKNFGVELGYVDMGKFKRNGGDTSAYGVNVSLVGNIPMSTVANLYAKVGSTYGWTKTNGSVAPTGDESGWGLSYALGVGFNLGPRTELMVQWDRDRFQFVDNDADVDLYTVGVKYRF